MIVVDAGALIAVLTIPKQAPELHERLLLAQLNGPHLVDLEVLSGLRGLNMAGKLDQQATGDALKDFIGMHLVRHGHMFLRSRIWELRHNATAYDAAYVALAELLEVPLVTTDVRISGIPDVRTRVEVFSQGRLDG